MSEAIGPVVSTLLIEAGLDPSDVEIVIARAIEEDLDGGEDVTTVATVPAEQRAELDFVARQPGVVAGVPVAAAVLSMVCDEHDLDLTFAKSDGDHVQPGDLVMSARARTHDLLRAERPALNLLGHLSGIATATALWAKALAHTKAKVRDTRKTTPGLRALEKYAVRCGGGVNHRMSLSDAALVKDNHVLAAGGVARAFELVRARYPQLTIEVEVDSLEQLAEVLDAGADLVLLDNFAVEDTRQAVGINAGRAKLESSGGLRLESAKAVAETGVDYLSVGALTHSAAVLDIGADLRTDS